MQKVAIRLTGTDYHKVEEVFTRSVRSLNAPGSTLQDPSRFPPVNLSFQSEESGWRRYGNRDCWQIRVHKRLIDIDADERALRQSMLYAGAKDIGIEIVLENGL